MFARKLHIRNFTYALTLLVNCLAYPWNETIIPAAALFSESHVLSNDVTLPNLMAMVFVSSDSFLRYCSENALTTYLVYRLHQTLKYFGVPCKTLPSAEELCLSVIVIILTLLFYFIFLGKNHVKKRKTLARDLHLAQLQVHFLEEKLILAKAEDLSASLPSDNNKKREIRIFMDGAFDMMHYGHMNAFRLGRSLGTHLIVGVNSDESIAKCKGAPLMNDQERLTMVEGCKFVDEIVPGCPYVMSKEYLDYVIDKFKVDYVIHGDDPCIVDGKDVYSSAKAAGKYQSIPRTEGVSTTDIIGRMLIMTKDHHFHEENGDVKVSPPQMSGRHITGLGHKSKFLTTSRMLRLFSAGVTAPTNDMKVIYIDGAWDMFHCGHVAVLRAAKKRGDYLIVGIHGDVTVNRIRGSNLPLMNLHERVLSVLGCQYVDDVLIDAPYNVTSDMIASLKIKEVVHGTLSDDMSIKTDDGERYEAAKKEGIFKVIDSPSSFSMRNIVTRIHKNHERFQSKIEKKIKAEDDYYDKKYGRPSQAK